MLELKEYHSTVEKYAVVAFKKVRKPTIHSVQDLVSEGMTVLYRIESKYDEKSPADFKTFLIRCLMNHYSQEIIKPSYKKNLYTSVDVEHLKYCQSNSFSDKTIEVMDVFEKLTLIEQRYLKAVLNPPKYIKDILKSIDHKRRRNVALKQLVCNYLEITEKQERDIRKIIKAHLTQEVK